MIHLGGLKPPMHSDYALKIIYILVSSGSGMFYYLAYSMYKN